MKGNIPLIKKIKALILVLVVVLGLVMAMYLALPASDRDELLPFSANEIIDFHVHVAGLGHGESGCYINKEMRDNFRFPFYLKALGVSEELLIEKGDKVLFELVSQSIDQSQVVGSAVILAMDGVVKNGVLNKEVTQIYVPNDYVFKETEKYKNLLFGASINPYRADAIERLERAHGQGALLIKWIPSIMYIDPSDESITKFYQRMVELNIPLLTHTGMEKSFSSAKDELADPLKLKLPLELGVTVIAAHIATTGESEGQDNFERILPMFERYPNLYADISSLTQVNKLGYLNKALKIDGLSERFIYGTDWPLQFFPIVSPWYHLDQISFSQAKAIQLMDNQWDKDIALKVAMGVSKSSFYRGERLFKKH